MTGVQVYAAARKNRKGSKLGKDRYDTIIYILDRNILCGTFI